MVDSINLVIEKIGKIDINYLIDVLKVENYYVNKEYSLISFIYKNIHFEFYYSFKNLVIKTTAHKILNKKDITIKDKEEFKNRVNNITNEVLKSNNILYNMKLTQVDFCVDVFFE